MIKRIYIPIILSDLDDFVQLTLSDDFLDEVFSKVQSSILDDIQFTENPVLEAVDTLIQNTIKELAKEDKYISKATKPKNN